MDQQKSMEKLNTPNPYLLAFLTAVLAGLFSVLGAYFTASFQTKQAVLQKQFGYRAEAYSTFLEKIDKAHAPIFAELLNIGSLSDHITTDEEKQALENHMAHLLLRTSPQDLYWQLNSDFNILRLHGTQSIQTHCEDILKLLVLRDREVNWSSYPESLQNYYQSWRKSQDSGVQYGWDAKVSEDERLMVIMVSRLFHSLVSQLRNELHNNDAAT